MSIDKYFDGNFAIFPTDYNRRSLEYIYDYAMYRARMENRSIIIICTSEEKEAKWNRIVDLYDFNSLIGVRVPWEGFRYFEGITEFYQDSITLQSIVIVDGAYDLIYGNQSLESLPEAERELRKKEWYQKSGEMHIDMSWEKHVKEEYENNFMALQDILNAFDDCPENKVFLIAECDESIITQERFNMAYPELVGHGDSVIGIVDKGNYIDETLIERRAKRKMRDIREDMKLSKDMHDMFDWKDADPFIVYL